MGALIDLSFVSFSFVAFSFVALLVGALQTEDVVQRLVWECKVRKKNVKIMK